MSKRKADVLQQKSPAEFFAENKNIAGFDNVSLVACLHRPVTCVAQTQVRPDGHTALLQPGKCLYTSVRELVENSLDAAESIGQLPDIAITMWVIELWVSEPYQMLSVCGRSSVCGIYNLTTPVCISREEISQKRLNNIRGIDNHERLDEELYHDFETDDARKVQQFVLSRLSTLLLWLSTWIDLQKRLTREAKELGKLEKTLSQAIPLGPPI